MGGAKGPVAVERALGLRKRLELDMSGVAHGWITAPAYTRCLQLATRVLPQPKTLAATGTSTRMHSASALCQAAVRNAHLPLLLTLPKEDLIVITHL